MNKHVAQILFFSGLMLFGLVVLMTITGACACLAGAGEEFFCGAYCITGKILLSLTVIMILAQAFMTLRKERY